MQKSAARGSIVPMRLNSIFANRHIFEGHINGRPLRLLLKFDIGHVLRLRVAADGAQMIVDDGPLDVPFDMDEYGQVDIADVTQALFPTLQGAEVEQIETLASNGKCVGVKLSAARRQSFHFWVDDDELYWGDGAAFGSYDWLDGAVPTASGRIEV